MIRSTRFLTWKAASAALCFVAAGAAAGAEPVKLVLQDPFSQHSNDFSPEAALVLHAILTTSSATQNWIPDTVIGGEYDLLPIARPGSALWGKPPLATGIFDLA